MSSKTKQDINQIYCSLRLDDGSTEHQLETQDYPNYPERYRNPCKTEFYYSGKHKYKQIPKTYKGLEAVVGTLSKPSKMPGYSYGIPAKDCVTGGKLAKIPGTVCHDCYAKKGMYRFPAVAQAQQKRLDSYKKDSNLWVIYITELIKRKVRASGVPYFRWHDSGDLQGANHYHDIECIAMDLPDINFWLPTKEYDIIKHMESPIKNLTVRVSDTKVGVLSQGELTEGMVKSSVLEPIDYDNFVEDEENVKCPAPQQNNECRDCRKCWSRDVKRVVYKKH